MDEGFVQRCIENIPENPGTAYDIGANRGGYTSMLGHRFGAVYAFEPHPDNLVELRESTAPLLNVFVVDKAVSDHNGICSLFTSANMGGHSVSKKVAATEKWGHKPDVFFNVECIKIDDFWKTHGSQVDFIKMDIEGAEDFVWNGAVEALKQSKPTIIMEVHQTVNCRDLHDFFRGLDYTWTDNQNQIVTEIHNDRHYLLKPR